MKLRRTDPTDRPGLVRTVRIDRRVDQLVARANPGDIAVIDVIDLDRRTAERLVQAGVSAVVNASSSCSGRFPVNGAQTLLEAGVVLLDDVGGEVFSRVRDGDTVRLEGSSVYAAGERVVDGDLQSDESVAEGNASARAGMRERLGALVADAGRRLAEDDGRLLEGDVFPPLNASFRDRVVVVLTSGSTPDELRTAKALVRRRNAVLVAVGGGADLARTARLRPDLVVVGRSAPVDDGFGRAREVLVLDGVDLQTPIPTGLPRAHSAAVGAAEDTAVLLAHTRGASLVVTLGLDETLGGLLDRSGVAGSVPFVTRLRDGGRHVSAAGASAALGEKRGRLLRVAAVTVVAVLALGAAAVGGAALTDDVTTPISPPVAAGAVGSDVADAQSFEAAVEPAILANRLRGHGVQLVVLPGAGSTTALADSLRRTGGSVSGPVVLGPAFVDPARARVLRDLALQLAPATVRAGIAAQPPSTPPATQLDEMLAASLAVPVVTSVGGSDAALGTLLTGLSRLDGLTAPAATRPSDLVVIAAPATASAATVTRTRDLVAAFARHGRAVVVVSTGAAPGSAATGLVGALRAGPADKDVATVDDGGTHTGQVAAVLALSAMLRRVPGGDYGTARGADAALPPL